MKPFRWSRGFTVSLFVGVLLACGIRQDEFDCENAVAHLQQCCPGFDASAIDCTYSNYCGPVYPALSISQSDCIRGKSCETIRAAGVCERAASVSSGPDFHGDVVSVVGDVCLGTPYPDAGPQVPSRPPPSGVSIACTSASDCTRGEACCASFSAAFGASSACAFAPCASGVQLCARSSECEAGKACTRPTANVNLFVCAFDVDASSDGASDGAMDAVSDAPPNDGDASPASDGSDGDTESGAEASADVGGP
jgi:hypothetical protein